MANPVRATYSTSVHSKNYVAVPTAASRRQGLFWRRYPNNRAEWVKYTNYNPRHLPVPTQYWDPHVSALKANLVVCLLGRFNTRYKFYL